MPRYIDADRVMEEIASMSSHNLCEWSTLGVKALIDRQPTADVAPRAEWISVEERLPDGNGVFLVSLKESGYENLVYFDVRPYADGDWRNLPDKFTVSHWMPLPEPPKGE
jgi:hypothetical protein